MLWPHGEGPLVSWKPLRMVGAIPTICSMDLRWYMDQCVVFNSYIF